MSNTFTRFSTKLTIILITVFGLHIAVLSLIDKPLFENKIILSYIINLTLAIAIFGFLYKYRERFKSQIGFLFLAGSFVKFAVFFLVFYPLYKADNDISKLEFAAFFVPYAICLILETSSLVKWLNKMDF